MAERIRQHAQRAKRGIDRVQIFDLVIEIALDGRVEFAGSGSLNQDFQEESKEIEIFFRRRERKRIDLEILGFQANADIRSAEKLCEAFKAPAQIENERVGFVFLKIRDEEVEEKRFPGARPAQDHAMSDIAIMEVKKIRRVVIGFEHRQIFLAEMLIARLATVQRKEKRKIRVVGIEQIQVTEVEDVVAGDCREKCVQKIVFFLVELRVMDAEHFVEFRARAVDLGRVEVIDD